MGPVTAARGDGQCPGGHWRARRMGSVDTPPAAHCHERMPHVLGIHPHHPDPTRAAEPDHAVTAAAANNMPDAYQQRQPSSLYRRRCRDRHPERSVAGVRDRSESNVERSPAYRQHRRSGCFRRSTYVGLVQPGTGESHLLTAQPVDSAGACGFGRLSGPYNRATWN